MSPTELEERFDTVSDIDWNNHRRWSKVTISGRKGANNNNSGFLWCLLGLAQLLLFLQLFTGCTLTGGGWMKQAVAEGEIGAVPPSHFRVSFPCRRNYRLEI